MNQVSIFRKFTQNLGPLPLETVLERIRSGYWSPKVEAMRALLQKGDRKAFDRAKQELDAMTVCGQFSPSHKITDLVNYSHYVILDFDKLKEEQLADVRRDLLKIPYTLACFLSPSGLGFKVIIEVTTGPEEHAFTVEWAMREYQAFTGVVPDPSGKDLSRLCFVSFDPELYLNPSPQLFDPRNCVTWRTMNPDVSFPGTGDALPGKPALPFNSTESEQPLGQLPPSGPTPAKAPADSRHSIRRLYKDCVNWVSRYHQFVEGNRNNFIYHLARQLKKRGFTESLTLMVILQDYNYDEHEVRSTVKSAFAASFASNGTGGRQDLPPRSAAGDGGGAGGNGSDKGAGTRGGDNGGGNKGLPPAPPSIPDLPDGEELPGQPRKKGRTGYQIKNVMQLLNDHFAFRYNVVTGLVEFRPLEERRYLRLEDKHENTIYCWLNECEQFIPPQILHMLLHSSFSPDYNPFHSYFEALEPWDQTTDYLGQLMATIETTNDPYFAFCFRKWFVAYVASVLDPKVINHTMIVLSGPQGIGKTQWILRLVPPALEEYIGNSIFQADSKDAAIQLAERMLIILDEIEGLNKKDINSLKELVTRGEIMVRKPYGRNPVHLPRIASLAGSVNHDKILTDPTGTRRFLCARVLQIDYRHRVSIDGCMAQALFLYRNGFQFYFDTKEIGMINEENEHFMVRSIEEEMIMTWFKPIRPEEFALRKRRGTANNLLVLTSTDIAIELTKRARLLITDQSVVKIGKLMNKLGYDKLNRSGVNCYLVELMEAVQVEGNQQSLDPVPIAPLWNTQTSIFDDDPYFENGDEEL